MSTLRASLLFFSLLLPGAGFAQQPAALNPSFNLVNRASTPIKEFYATPEAAATKWGRDLLEGRSLAPGAKTPIRLRADGKCVYDLRALFADGHFEEKRGLNACQSEDVAMGEAAPPAAKSFRLLNRGTAPITSIGARAQGTDKWRTNNLRTGPIPAGGERRIDLPPGGKCVFDLRVTFEGGKSSEKTAADLCTSPDQAVQ